MQSIVEYRSMGNGLHLTHANETDSRPCLSLQTDPHIPRQE